MQKSTFTSHVEASAADVFEWHEQPGAVHRLLPPWDPVDVLKHGGLSEGSRVKLRLRVGPLPVTWVAKHVDVVPGSRFSDEQVRGPFRRWKHVHHMSDEQGGCRLSDELEYDLPLAGLTTPVAGGAVRRRIERHFAYRHRTTRNDLRRKARYGRRTWRVAVSGSSGLIGDALVQFHEAGGHDVLHIVRHEPVDSARQVYWNHREDILEVEKLQGIDAVIHLAGENVLVPRWSEQKKMEVLNSRVGGTAHLADRLSRMDDPPATLLAASGIGYYGSRGEDRLDESEPAGDDGFLAVVCQEWERAAFAASEAGIRTVHMRVGIVLTPAGGILSALLPPFRSGLGGRYGGSHQYLSWIGLDDTVGAIYHLLHHDEIDGPVNLTASHPVTMSEFAETLGHVLSRPTAINLPPSLIRVVLGEVADEAALMSVHAVPSRLDASGFEFFYPTLEGMLRHALGRTLDPIDGVRAR